MDMQKAFEQKWLIENQKSIKADVDVVLTFCESENKYKVNSLKAMKPEAIELCELVNFDYSIWCEAWQAAKANAVPQWISTSDRMPEEGEEVLVHNLGQVRQVTRDSKWVGGFKERNCYGWQAAYSQSHWMPKSIELPKDYHFYYENDAKQKAMIEAQEQTQ